MCSHAWPIELILIEHKVVAMSVYNKSNKDVAAKRLQILKRGCFTHTHTHTHTFNLAAQKIYTVTTVSR